MKNKKQDQALLTQLQLINELVLLLRTTKEKLIKHECSTCQSDLNAQGQVYDHWLELVLDIKL